jgi:hypothetical protein
MDPLCSPPWVLAEVAHSMADWRHSAGDWPRRAPRFTVWAQRSREKAYYRTLHAVERHAKDASPSDPAHTQQKLVTCFARFAAEGLDLGPDAVDLFTGGFLPRRYPALLQRARAQELQR